MPLVDQASTPRPGQTVVSATVTPQLADVDLGGVTAHTWAYDGVVPGKVLRARAGDFVQVTVNNTLPAATTIHWHGVHLRNPADGVPGVTQAPIAPGARYGYAFTAQNPGTHFFHPHVGAQLDRGLYAPLIIDDPTEAGDYDAEWIVVLDDWTDGVGKNPDDILAEFQAQNGPVTDMNAMSGGPSMGGGMGSMPGMPGMSSMPGMGSGPSMDSGLGDAGDVAYPYFVLNGRISSAPTVFAARSGQRIRIRLINAAADTVFRVALGGHTMRVTHSDGYRVQDKDTQALWIAMGERYDVMVTAADGVFPLVAVPEGKKGQAMALLRSGAGGAPPAPVRPSELDTQPLAGATDLVAADSAKLPGHKPDATVPVHLNGQMSPYGWGINGKKYGQDTPLSVATGQRLRMTISNMTSMLHPMHIHGHTWSLPDSGGLRKDTVMVKPMQTITADLQANNPGAWALHCHNIYHSEVGMMTTLRYRT